MNVPSLLLETYPSTTDNSDWLVSTAELEKATKNNQPIFRTIDEKLEYWVALNERGTVSTSLISTSGLLARSRSHCHYHVFLLAVQKFGSRRQRSFQATRRTWGAKTANFYFIVVLLYLATSDVSDFNRPGEFFGQISNAAKDGLDELSAELKKAYSSLHTPSLLYAYCNSHLGDIGVIEHGRKKTVINSFFTYTW